ncbi:hypothetical protein Q0590_35705 [Rhodocytophaga aerolata]|uniref:Uncharacterized protein n=1 Tax=Rhodocytophaga aerolata TaxID=455078 RepID=A0ABT8RJP5_9BACT|nr:hypothetical protein [Rhodocytophaga aerolata]MDO1451674.1 hypothetical protein [Rhodocytophaga aerolata]
MMSEIPSEPILIYIAGHSSNNMLMIELVAYNAMGSKSGIGIDVRQNVFTFKPVFTTDYIDLSQGDPSQTIELTSFSQAAELELDKSRYQAGDSLYGKIYMRAGKEKGKMYAYGHFRTKIL